jgi:hypothetical protein
MEIWRELGCRFIFGALSSERLTRDKAGDAQSNLLHARWSSRRTIDWGNGVKVAKQRLKRQVERPGAGDIPSRVVWKSIAARLAGGRSPAGRLAPNPPDPEPPRAPELGGRARETAYRIND